MKLPFDAIVTALLGLCVWAFASGKMPLNRNPELNVELLQRHGRLLRVATIVLLIFAAFLLIRWLMFAW